MGYPDTNVISHGRVNQSCWRTNTDNFLWLQKNEIHN